MSDPNHHSDPGPLYEIEPKNKFFAALHRWRIMRFARAIRFLSFPRLI